MNNPLALRLGITKNWSNDSNDLNLIKGYLRALDTHTSEIYLQTHTNTNHIYLYLYISHLRYSKRNKISLYRSFIKFIRNDVKNNKKNFIQYYKFRFPKIQSFYILYYIKLLKLLLNNNNYNIHIINLKRISRNTNIYLSYLTHYLSLKAKIKLTFLKIYYYNRPMLSYPRKYIHTNYKGDKKVLNIKNYTDLNNLNISKNYLHFYYSDLIKNNKIDNNKFKFIQNFLISNNLNYIKNFKLRNKIFNLYLKNKFFVLSDLKDHFLENKYKIKLGRKRKIWVHRLKFRRFKRFKFFMLKKFLNNIKTFNSFYKNPFIPRLYWNKFKIKTYKNYNLGYKKYNKTYKKFNMAKTKTKIFTIFRIIKLIKYFNILIKINFKTDKNKSLLLNYELNHNVFKDLLIR